MDCVFRHVRYWLFLDAKLLWILADMSGWLILAALEVFLLKNDELLKTCLVKTRS